MENDKHLWSVQNEEKEDEGSAVNQNVPVAYPGILFGGGGVQQIQLRTEERENRDLGVVAP